MTQDLNDAFVEAAQECYRRVRALRQGSEAAEVAEHALTLLLFGQRSGTDPAALLRDALRNAQFSVRRGRARRLIAIDDASHLARQGIATAAAGASAHAGVEDRVSASDLLARLRDEASQCGASGPEILADLLDGNTTREIAERAAVSVATVNRTIARLRAAAQRNGYCEAA